MAAASAQIELQALAGFETCQGRQVGFGQVVDVDVIANAGAVGRGVVVAEDRDLGPLSKATASTIGIRCVSGSWSSPNAPWHGAGGVEVP